MLFYLGAFGSAGDVHPMIGIGQALQSRRHEVTLVATSYFEPMAQRARLQHLNPMPDFDYRKIIEDPDLWHPVRGSRVLFGIMQRSIESAYRLMQELHVPGKTVFVGSSFALGMRLAQVFHGIPLATVHLSAFFFRSRTKGPRFYGVYRPEWAAGIVKDWQYKLIDALAIVVVWARRSSGFSPSMGCRRRGAFWAPGYIRRNSSWRSSQIGSLLRKPIGRRKPCSPGFPCVMNARQPHRRPSWSRSSAKVRRRSSLLPAVRTSNRKQDAFFKRLLVLAADSGGEGCSSLALANPFRRTCPTAFAISSSCRSVGCHRGPPRSCITAASAR